MGVFLFWQKKMLALASIMELWHISKPSKTKLRKTLLLKSYPFFSPFFVFVYVHIMPVINIMPENITIKNTKVSSKNSISLLEGFSFKTKSFKRSAKKVATSRKNIPKPLLISLSSSYFRFSIKDLYQINSFPVKKTQKSLKKSQKQGGNNGRSYT